MAHLLLDHGASPFLESELEGQTMRYRVFLPSAPDSLMLAAFLALPCLLLLACAAGPRGSSTAVSADAPRTAGTASSWRSADGRLAVLLLSIVTQSEGEAPEQRWMVLTTDGRRLWPAVGEAGQQLRVPAVALVEQQGQLQLHVRQSRTSVYAFDPRTGRFITQ